MIKTIIIDDEANARDFLKEILLQQFPGISVIETADDVESGIAAIRKHKPNLVFLDMQMPQGTGFDLLKAFDEVDFEVIFVTAYDNYAVQAFQFSAFGYLLKPINIGELREVIGRLESHIAEIGKQSAKRLKILIENYGDDRKIRKLVIQNVEGFEVVEVDSIVRLKGDWNYSHFHFLDGKSIVATRTLKDYETLLHPYGFLRIHQSHIINLRHVRSFQKRQGGRVIMQDDAELPISRKRKALFLERFI